MLDRRQTDLDVFVGKVRVLSGDSTEIINRGTSMGLYTGGSGGLHRLAAHPVELHDDL